MSQNIITTIVNDTLKLSVNRTVKLTHHWVNSKYQFTSKWVKISFN